jgi:hypothetical protein
VLQVPASASPDQIRRAYRRLLKRYHPDLNPEDPDAERRFRQVLAAYEAVRWTVERPRRDGSPRRAAPMPPVVAFEEYGYGMRRKRRMKIPHRWIIESIVLIGWVAGAVLFILDREPAHSTAPASTLRAIPDTRTARSSNPTSPTNAGPRTPRRNRGSVERNRTSGMPGGVGTAIMRYDQTLFDQYDIGMIEPYEGPESEDDGLSPGLLVGLLPQGLGGRHPLALDGSADQHAIWGAFPDEWGTVWNSSDARGIGDYEPSRTESSWPRSAWGVGMRYGPGPITFPRFIDPDAAEPESPNNLSESAE